LAELAPAPNFLIAGIGGNATRWLRSNLDRHPDICAPPVDTRFFTDEERLAALGHRWYREQFPDWQGQPLIGECSPSYLKWSNGPGAIANRIRKHLKEVRVVAIVGDPLERYLSGIARAIRWGRLPSDDPGGLYRFEVEPERCFAEVSASIQGLSVHAFRLRLGDQLLVVFRDDIIADPAHAYRSVLEHIGADPAFVPDGIATVRFDDVAAIRLERPSLEEHQALYSWWRVDVDKLAEQEGRDLSVWDPGVNPNAPSPEELMAEMMAAAAANEGSEAS